MIPAISPEVAEAIFQHHLISPEISMEEYFRRKVSLIGRGIVARRKLYLDTRYWVFIRDASLGRPKRLEHIEILSLLRQLVSDGLAICPVSDVAFMELSSQSDDETRKETAKLLDELSLGVALHSEPYRVRCEIESVLREPTKTNAVSALSEIVWCPPSYVLGPVVPSNEKLPKNIQLAIQKSFTDLQWGSSFVDLTKKSSADLAMSFRFEETAQKINVDMRRFQHEVPSIEKAFLAEIHGALKVHENSVLTVLLRLYEEQGYSLDNEPAQRFIEFRDTMLKGLVNSFRYARKAMATRLPSIYMHAAFHAAIRMDVKRKVNGNFLRDLHHGNAGVVYHDAMFTERPLQVLLMAGNVSADKTFGCSVMSSEADVIAYLKSI